MAKSKKDLIRAWADLQEESKGPKRGRQQNNVDMTIGPPRDTRVKVRRPKK